MLDIKRLKNEIYTLKIKNKIISILTGGILVSFPVITYLFGYMFASGMYSFGTFMGLVKN